ncbi:MAG: hypothetical protein Q7R99_03350 [bacterium]|nr:hypothetical protein [bacterium]
MPLIKKVSSNFSLVKDGEYNVDHWRKVKPITHIGVKEGSCIAFFNISGGVVDDGSLSGGGWNYYGIFGTVQGIRVLQVSPKVAWEAIEWKGNEKDLVRKVPPLPPNPNRKKRKVSYRW